MVRSFITPRGEGSPDPLAEIIAELTEAVDRLDHTAEMQLASKGTGGGNGNGGKAKAMWELLVKVLVPVLFAIALPAAALLLSHESRINVQEAESYTKEAGSAVESDMRVHEQQYEDLLRRVQALEAGR